MANPTGLANQFRGMVDKLVNKFGAEGCFIRRRFQNIDPTNPTSPGVQMVKDYPCKAAVTSFKENEVKFVNVVRGDMQAVVAWSPELPHDIHPGDQFYDGELMYNIIPPQEVEKVNGQIVAWILQLRR